MSRSHSAELLFLLGLSAPAIACDDDAHEHRDEADAAVDACQPFADLIDHCYGEDYGRMYLVGLGSCIAALGEADVESPDCRTAQEDYYACLGEMDCSELKNGQGPCSEHEAVVEGECDLSSRPSGPDFIDDDSSEDSGDAG
jgi:hypothetical protein